MSAIKCHDSILELQDKSRSIGAAPTNDEDILWYHPSISFQPTTCRHSVLKQLVSWCCKPSQPQRIISGLKETFMKRYLVESTNKAEIRPEEQSQKMESCWEYLWIEIQLKGPHRQK